MKTISRKDQESAFAEVVESTLQTFSGCCWKWNVAPEFGSLIKVQQQEKLIYAVVYDIKTTTLDPMREVHVYQKTEEEMRKEYPHLFDFLKTTFQALVIGYLDQNQCKYQRPKTPVKLYSFIEHPEQNELQAFFSHVKSMSLILNPGIIIEQYEDLLCSIIETQKKLHILSQDRLTSIMTQYAFSTNASYRQLKHFFDRIS
jgi:hypothetical protein